MQAWAQIKATTKVKKGVNAALAQLNLLLKAILLIEHKACHIGMNVLLLSFARMKTAFLKTSTFL